MDVVKLDKDKYCVMKWYEKANEYIHNDDGTVEYKQICPPVLDRKLIFTTDTEAKAYDYIFKNIDHSLRQADLNLEKISSDWERDVFYKPISQDIINDIKHEIALPMKYDSPVPYRPYNYMSNQEQEKYKEEKLGIVLYRLWKAFNLNNNNGHITYGGKRKTILLFTNDNIELYKNSTYYQKYKNEIIDIMTRLLNEYVKEPELPNESKPPNSIHIISNKEKKTAPTLKEGWVVYIFFMVLEVLFVGTIGLWVPTTILFILWRKKEIRKYNWKMNDNDRKHFDPWKRKY